MASKTFRRRERHDGFTLIELLVSIGLFSVVVIIVAGAISSVINANKQAQVVTSVVNNLNFTLESMTRAIKTGEMSDSFLSAGVCAESISLTDAQNRAVTYEKTTITGPDGNPRGAINLTVVSPSGTSDSPITAPEIVIDVLEFCPLAGQQPAVFFRVSGSMSLSGGIDTDFHVQTTVAQRALKI